MVSLAIGAVLASWIVFLVLRYAVGIPMLDDWEMVAVVTKAHMGELTFADLFAQQQEARTILPKLIFIALSYGRYWDSRTAMILSVVVCCLTALGIYRMLGRSGLPGRAIVIAFLLSVVLLFSPAQHEIWLLASGFPSFLPALFIVWGICVATGTRSIAAKFGVCAALAVCASFTLANGLLAWPLTFPCVFLLPARPAKRWLGYWLVACAICAAIYFWHFNPPNDVPGFAPRKTLFDYWQYIAAFLGSGLGRSGNEYPLASSVVIGSVLLCGYFVGMGYVIYRRHDHRLRAEVVPWLMLGAYSILSAFLAALGRIEFGLGQALESRYIAFSIYLAIATIVLGAIGSARLLKTPKRPWRLTALAVITFLAAGALTLELSCAFGSVATFRIRSAAGRLGQSAVLFGSAIDTSRIIQAVNFPRPSFVKEKAEVLDRLHLLQRPLVRTRELDKLRRGELDNQMAAGSWDVLTTGSDGRSMAWGWAALPARNRPADAVLLAYAINEGEWIAFALADEVLDRPDVVRFLRSADQLWSGWRVTFRNDELPKGAKISFWAVDAKESKLYPLQTKPLSSKL